VREELRQALEDCLRALERGEDVERSLERYPHLAQELRPLLEAARSLRVLGRQLPPPEARVRSWLLFSRRAADLQARRRRWAWRWLSPLALAASLTLAVALGMALTALAASRSLPDSPLYRVKLAMEEARVFLTWDEEAKAALLLGQAEARQREIEELLDRGKSVPGIALSALRSRIGRVSGILANRQGEDRARALSLSQRLEELLLRLGPRLQVEAHDEFVAALATVHNARLRLLGRAPSVRLEDLASGLLFLEGVARPTDDPRIWEIGQERVRVDEATIVPAGGLEEGRVVRVLAGVGADGRLRALTVTPLGLPGVEIVLQGMVEGKEGDELVVEGQRIRLWQEDMAQGVRVGDLVQVRAYKGQEGMVAAELRVLTPLDMAATVIIEGPAEGGEATAGGATTWRVGGHTLRVLPTTVVVAEAGALRPGARVRVVARQLDHTLVAERIVVLEQQAPAPQMVAVQGVFQRGEDGRWKVGGVEVEPPPQAPAPEPGSVLRVEAVQEDGQVKAKQVVVVAGPDSTGMAHLRGTIAEMGDERWTVDGTTVLITAETTVSGQPAVGAQVEVWGDLQPDGSIVATYVEVAGAEEQAPPAQGTSEATPSAATPVPAQATPTPMPEGATVTPAPPQATPRP